MAATRAEVEKRLLENRLIDENGCWLWTKSCRSSGYGQTSFKRSRNIAVHRVAACLWLGFDLDSPLCVLHCCDTPRCFNPDQLFIGTKADNTHDMVRKGRARGGVRRGTSQSQARLTDPKVREIRRLRENGETLHSVGRRYGVSHALIWNIEKRIAWAHVN